MYNKLLLCTLALVAMRCAAHSTHADQDASVCEKVVHTHTVQWNRKVLLGGGFTVAPPTLVEGRPSVSALNANPAMQCNVSALNAMQRHCP